MNVDSAVLLLAARDGDLSPTDRSTLLREAREVAHAAAGAGGVRSVVDPAVATVRRLLARFDAADTDAQDLIAWCDRAAPVAPTLTIAAEASASTADDEPDDGSDAVEVAATPSGPLDVKRATRRLGKLRRGLEEAEVAASALDERAAHDEAALEAAEAEALPHADNDPRWAAHAKASARAAKSKARAKHAHQELDRMRADVAAQERAIVQARYDEALGRTSVAAIDAALEGAVEILVENAVRAREATDRARRIAHTVVVAYQRAVADVRAAGRDLGLESREVTAQLREVDPMSLLRRVDVLAGERLAAIDAQAKASTEAPARAAE